MQLDLDGDSSFSCGIAHSQAPGGFSGAAGSEPPPPPPPLYWDAPGPEHETSLQSS